MAPELAPLDDLMDEIQVRLVDWLPAACAGAVVYKDDDGTRWALLEPWYLWRPPADLESWFPWGLWIQDTEGIVCAADYAEQFDVPLEVARGAWWLIAVEWWKRKAERPSAVPAA